MARIDVADQSIRGTWVDGYLPGPKKMKDLTRRYPLLSYRAYPNNWSQEDYFGEIAATIRGKYDFNNLPSGIRPVPCLAWIAKIDKQPSDTKLQPIFKEYVADPKQQDYFHFITVHEECPVKEGCLQNVLGDLSFEVKPEKAYKDYKHFADAVEHLLGWYVGLLAAPHLEVEKHLDSISHNIPCGP